MRAAAATRRRDDEGRTATLRLTLVGNATAAVDPGSLTGGKEAATTEQQQLHHSVTIVPVCYAAVGFASTAASSSHAGAQVHAANDPALRPHPRTSQRQRLSHLRPAGTTAADAILVREFFKAVYQGRPADVVHFLRLVSVRCVDPDDGRTPLMAALHVAHAGARVRTFDCLAERGAALDGRPDTVLGRDLIGWACALGRHEELRKILHPPAVVSPTPQLDCHRRDAHGQTCLHLAVASGSVETVAVLLMAIERRRASAEHLNAQGLTPYLLARKLGHDEIARMMLLRRSRRGLDDSEAEAEAEVTLGSAEMARAEQRRARQRVRQQNWSVLPLPSAAAPTRKLERGETYAEALMKAIGGPGSGSTSQQLLHSALDLWSEQHFHSYRRGVAPGAAAAEAAAAAQAGRSSEADAVGRRGRRLGGGGAGRRLDSRIR